MRIYVWFKSWCDYPKLSSKIWERKKMYHKNSSFQIRVFILFDDCQFKTPSWPLFIFLSNTTEFDFTLIVSCREDLELTKKQIDKIHLWCTQSSPILWLTRIWFLQISLKTWLFEKLPFLNLSHTMKIALYEIMRLDYF